MGRTIRPRSPLWWWEVVVGVSEREGGGSGRPRPRPLPHCCGCGHIVWLRRRRFGHFHGPARCHSHVGLWSKSSSLLWLALLQHGPISVAVIFSDFVAVGLACFLSPLAAFLMWGATVAVVKVVVVGQQTKRRK
jgi:hypothetical protein